MKQMWLACGAMALVLGLSDRGPVVASNQPAPVTKESSQTFRRVVKKVLPSVVKVTSKVKPVGVSRNNSKPRIPFQRPRTQEEMRKEFKKFQEEMRKKFDKCFGEFLGLDPVLDRFPSPRGISASGVIVGEGIILTNNHVVAGTESVKIRLQNGRTFESSDIVQDPKSDLAIIKLDPKDAKGLPVAELGDSSTLEIGDWVLAMGSPSGLQGTVTAGIISAKSRAVDVTNYHLYEEFLQTDAPINPGSSGGPLVNLDGQVIGINTAGWTDDDDKKSEGIGFAIPSTMVKDVLDQLVKYGKVNRGYLGIQMAQLEQKDLDNLNLDHGIEITFLPASQTPALKAGFQGKDIILEVNGLPIETSTQLQRMVLNSPIGKKMELKILRDGKPKKISVTIEEQPTNFGQTVTRWGLRFHLGFEFGQKGFRAFIKFPVKRLLHSDDSA